MTELAVRSLVARVGALPAAAALALVALPASSDAASATPVGYAVTTAGAAVRVVSTQRPAFSIATGDVVDQTLGLVGSSYGSSTSESRAASYYPGDLLAQAGQLICGQFGPCPVEPPAYPLLAEASWPTVEHAMVQPAGPAAGTASATATSTGNAASTTAAGSASGGLTLGGSSSSTSTTTGADGLRVRVATTLHDVSLGPLAIRSVRVTDDVLVRPDGRTTSTPHVVTGGVTVAGEPVELGSTPLPGLAARGLTVRVIGTEKAGARSGATGVRIDLSVPVQGVGAPAPGLPNPDRTYVSSFVLGQVSVLAARDDQFQLPTLPLPTVPPTGLGGYQPAAGGAPLAGSGPVAPPVPPAVSGPPASWLVLRSFRLDDFDLTHLYAVLALGALGGLAGSRLLSRRAWS